MKSNNFSNRFAKNIGLLSLVSVFLISCGSYQSVYNDDGIYDETVAYDALTGLGGDVDKSLDDDAVQVAYSSIFTEFNNLGVSPKL